MFKGPNPPPRKGQEMFKGTEPSFYGGDKTCLKGPNPPFMEGIRHIKGTGTLTKNILCWLINSYGSTFIFIPNFVLFSVRLYFWSHFHYFSKCRFIVFHVSSTFLLVDTFWFWFWIFNSGWKRGWVYSFTVWTHSAQDGFAWFV